MHTENQKTMEVHIYMPHTMTCMHVVVQNDKQQQTGVRTHLLAPAA